MYDMRVELYDMMDGLYNLRVELYAIILYNKE